MRNKKMRDQVRDEKYARCEIKKGEMGDNKMREAR